MIQNACASGKGRLHVEQQLAAMAWQAVWDVDVKKNGRQAGMHATEILSTTQEAAAQDESSCTSTTW